MYPYTLFLNMGFYELFMALGVIAAIVIFARFSDRNGISPGVHNLVLLDTVLSVAFGYFSAVAAQALYNMLGGETEGYEITKSTGATFLGGLVGGAAFFIGFYFLWGKLNRKIPAGEPARFFPLVVDIAAVSIPAAHGFGRLGCLMAGCCYGRVYPEPNAFTFHFPILNINDEVIGYRDALPVQLYEAVFLLLLAAVLAVLLARGVRGQMAYYMVTYGVWRYFIEFLRGDDRGETVIRSFSPSQLVSLLLVAGGVVLLYFHFREKAEKRENAGE